MQNAELVFVFMTAFFSHKLDFRILESASGTKFPVSRATMLALNLYCSKATLTTHHSPESCTHLKTHWAQNAWLLVFNFQKESGFFLCTGRRLKKKFSEKGCPGKSGFLFICSLVHCQDCFWALYRQNSFWDYVSLWSSFFSYQKVGCFVFQKYFSSALPRKKISLQ